MLLGKLDTYGDFNHEKIPYRTDSTLQDGSDNGVDLTGGYFDGKVYPKFFGSSQFRVSTAVLRSIFKISKRKSFKIVLITSCTPMKLI